MLRLRLRAVIPVSFGRSEETNFDSLYWARQYHSLIASMDPEDVICLVSIGQNQLQFVHGYIQMKTKGKKPWRGLFSVKLRLKKHPDFSGTFEPLMLANYAKYLGIELVGLKMFEEYFEHLTK